MTPPHKFQATPLQISSWPPPYPQPPQTVSKPSRPHAPRVAETACRLPTHRFHLPAHAAPRSKPFSSPSNPHTHSHLPIIGHNPTPSAPQAARLNNIQGGICGEKQWGGFI